MGERRESRAPLKSSICKWKVQLAGMRRERVSPFSVFAGVFQFGAGQGAFTPNYQSAAADKISHDLTSQQTSGVYYGRIPSLVVAERGSSTR